MMGLHVEEQDAVKSERQGDSWSPSATPFGAVLEDGENLVMPIG